MRSSSDSVSGQRNPDSTQAKAGECHTGSCNKRCKLYVVGTGPGSPDHMSQRAIAVLQKADSVAGYSTYINLIKDKKIISTGMMKEVERVEKAIDQALKGRRCALVSGGDPGIYAMAGLVFEICRQRDIKLLRNSNIDVTNEHEKMIELEIVPGIPALAAGAALAGAPLTHDFAAVSLSDLLTPWTKIEARLTHAVQADFVIVLYNPKSKKRDWQLKRAQELILEHRDSKTPVAIVTGAMRDNQEISFTTLGDLDQALVGMQTVVFIGSSSSIRYMDFLFTPRGYSHKYSI
ncbi:MAG: precorrin-3B C(17)-methyltransferase [Desulfobacteraceae bacterium]|nr:precorrin-3B C(17)-methyltransferase [Desulfobacteraceae bacterium]